MGDGHSCTHTDPDHYSTDCCPRANHQRCGAVLLTPTVLQTSCNCLALFKKTPVDNWTMPTIMHSWEDKLDIFIGYNLVSQYRFGILSRKFYIHEKCAQLAVAPFWLVTHDYGIVTLRSPADERDLKFLEQDYAPIYPVSELARIFAHTMNTRAVCLTLGFGCYQWSHGRVDPDVKSDELRHGWVTNQEYWKCYYWTVKEFSVPEGTFDFGTHATWICGIQPFKHNEYIAMGDEGGPLSCNNQYFGVIGQRMNITKSGPDTGKILQTSSAIAFNPFDNSMEYREDFERVIQEPNEPTFKPLIASDWPFHIT